MYHQTSGYCQPVTHVASTPSILSRSRCSAVQLSLGVFSFHQIVSSRLLRHSLLGGGRKRGAAATWTPVGVELNRMRPDMLKGGACLFDTRPPRGIPASASIIPGKCVFFFYARRFRQLLAGSTSICRASKGVLTLPELISITRRIKQNDPKDAGAAHVGLEIAVKVCS